MHHHRHHGGRGHHGHASAGKHRHHDHARRHHGGKGHAADAGRAVPAAGPLEAGSSFAAPPGAATLERAHTLQAGHPVTDEGCPRTGGSGECLGDCRTCPYRGL